MIETFIVLASTYWQDQNVYNGTRFNPYSLTAASRSLVLGSCIMVEYKGTQSKVLINDRGPCFSKKCQAERPDLLKRELDLSLGTATILKFNGLDKVKYWKVKC